MGLQDKCDSKGNMESYKASLVAKWFTQIEGIDYNEHARILLES